MASMYSSQIVNSMTSQTPHDKQVLLEVKFAEVDRTKLQQFGINIISTGAGNTPGQISTNQFASASGAANLNGVIGAPLKGFSSGVQLQNLLNVFLFRPDLNLAATLQDMESKNVLQILASPNLLAMNGQKASFLAGGEFPFPVVQGTQNIGSVTIQFRPFGVKLDFTGFIGADNVIRMHVAPEVSTLDFTNAVTLSGFTVPAISTRRAETDVELKDGQSFGIAGLMDNRVTTQLSKMPGFGDIPVLGQLFRSKSINRTNSELVVVVTPHIVDPLAPNQPPIVLPNYPFPFLQIPNFDTSVGAVKKEGTSPQPNHN
jgi:pilus assembly protein CpaC